MTIINTSFENIHGDSCMSIFANSVANLEGATLKNITGDIGVGIVSGLNV